MTELPEPQGVQPVLDAIDRLHAELENYPRGSDNFEAARTFLESVLTSVKHTLMDACNQYNDADDTYRAFKMEGVEE